MLDEVALLQANITRDLMLFAPELLTCGGVVLLLLLRLFPTTSKTHLHWVAMVFTVGALALSLFQWGGESYIRWIPEYLRNLFLLDSMAAVFKGYDNTLFSGMLVYDRFTIFLRMFLYGFTALVVWLSMITGIPDREDSPDFYALILGSVVGMALMASANHLLMVFIGVEMASVPSYVLAGFLKGRRRSSEAALKYVVYGGGSAGIMLYGISLIAGTFGTGYLPDVAYGFNTVLANVGQRSSPDMILILGTLFIMVGIAFKLAAVPFHFWCPDIFEGASAEVAGFLSVASKGAALALLARFTLVLGGLDPLVGGVTPSMNWVIYLVPTLAFFATLTATFGNLAAYFQTNLKRLLAYSTIAHAGYMMMGLATLTRSGAEAVLFYLIAYLFMNLGAFAVVAFLRNQLGSEDLDDYRGLVRRSPFMVVTLSFFLLSLLGIPPLVGFTAKFQLFRVLFEESQRYAAAPSPQPGLSATLYGLLIVGGLNTVLSAIYYIKVMKVMIIEQRAEDIEGQEPQPLREPFGAKLYAGLLALVLFVLGILWGPLSQASQLGTERFKTAKGSRVAQARQGN